MASSSNRLLIIGLIVFVLGAALVLVVTRSGDEEPAPAAQSQAQAAEATAPVPVAQPAAATEVRIPRPLALPDGYEALALTLDFSEAVAGLPAPGDRVNLFGVFQNHTPRALEASAAGQPVTDAAGSDVPEPAVKLLAANVEVLAATGAIAENAGGATTVVVAVDAASAEKLLYANAFEQLHATLVHTDAQVPQTSGVTAENVVGPATIDLRPADAAPAADTTATSGSDQ